MNWKALQRGGRILLPLGCALVLLWGGGALAGENWVDEVWNMVMFEKASYPGSNFDPYLAKLDRIRSGIDRGDQKFVKMETDRFLKMLLDRRHGINDVAADEIYNFVLTTRANEQEQTAASAPIELGTTTERPMGVPNHTVNTPYEGGQFCGSAGCDYWIDDVYDPGAAG